MTEFDEKGLRGLDEALRFSARAAGYVFPDTTAEGLIPEDEPQALPLNIPQGAPRGPDCGPGPVPGGAHRCPRRAAAPGRALHRQGDLVHHERGVGEALAHAELG